VRQRSTELNTPTLNSKLDKALAPHIAIALALERKLIYLKHGIHRVINVTDPNEKNEKISNYHQSQKWSSPSKYNVLY